MQPHTSLFAGIDFGNRMTPEAYLAGMNENADTARAMYEKAFLTAPERDAIERAVAKRGGRIDAAALTADWCGDAAMILPLLFAAADTVAGLRARVFRADELPEVKARLDAEGFDRYPVVIFFDADGREIGRFMERTARAHELVLGFLADKPDPEALLATEERAKVAEAIGIFKACLAEMQVWYPAELWRGTVAAWLDLVG